MFGDLIKLKKQLRELLASIPSTAGWLLMATILVTAGTVLLSGCLIIWAKPKHKIKKSAAVMMTAVIKFL